MKYPFKQRPSGIIYCLLYSSVEKSQRKTENEGRERGKETKEREGEERYGERIKCTKTINNKGIPH